MSLIHWWPLNGDLKDYGVKHINLVVTNAPSTQYVSGKIGQCYNFNGEAWMQASGVSVGTNCSICCWAKTSSYGAMFWGMQCSASDYMNLYNCGPICLNVGDSADNPFGSVSAVSDGIWHHYVVVFKGSEKAKLYIDGIYRAEAKTYRNPTMNNQNFTIATWNYSSHGYYWNGGINDVRIYDHALSAKEVKEISKGLVLHYDFNDPYVEGTMNVVSNPSTFSNWTSYVNGYTSITDCELGGKKVVIDNILSWCGIYKSLTLPSPGTYTISVWCKPISRTSSSIRQTVYTSGGGISDTDASAVWENLGTWQRVSMTRTYTTTSIYLYLIAYGGDGSGRISCEYTMPQIEEKDHATPYVNGTRSAGIISDSSGYGYNGAVNGNLQILDSTPMGSYCAKFDSNVYIDISKELPNFNTGTFSFWIDIGNNDAQAYRDIFSKKNNLFSGLWISLNTESYGLWAYQGDNTPNYCRANSYCSSNTWYYCSFVFNNGVGTWYMNGVQVGSPVTYTEHNYITGGSYALGDSYTGTSFDGTPFIGKIADFKIYATALSASDILAEYQRKASIDKSGILFTGEFEEGNSTNINVTKSTMVKCNNIVEGSSIVKFLKGYTQLEYIEGTGTQYIDSNYIPNINTTIVGRYMNTENAEDTPLFGTRTSSMTKSYTFWAHPSDHINTSWYSQMIFNGTYADFSRNACKAHGEINSFYFSKTVCIINNERKTISVSSGTPDLSLIIFGLRNGSSIDSRKFIGRIYEFKIYEEKEMIRDFIPVKDKNGTIGMFDLVNRTFYTNAGSGTFTAGPEIGKINAIYANEIKEI